RREQGRRRWRRSRAPRRRRPGSGRVAAGVASGAIGFRRRPGARHVAGHARGRRPGRPGPARPAGPAGAGVRGRPRVMVLPPLHRGPHGPRFRWFAGLRCLEAVARRLPLPLSGRSSTLNLKLVGAVVIVLAALGAAACTSKTTVNAPGAAQNGITVTGSGQAFGSPDVAVITLGVQAQAATVADARETAASTAQAVIDSVKKNGVADKDIQTT